MRVLRNLMVHDAIAKQNLLIAKIMLHQLRERFKTLSFSKRMELYPDVFEELFVSRDKEVTLARLGKDNQGCISNCTRMH